MNKQALFCDGTESYVIPAQPDMNQKIKLMFRTGKNDVDKVRLLTGAGGYPILKEK